MLYEPYVYQDELAAVIDKIAPKFVSGNNVKVDRAYVTLEEMQELQRGAKTETGRVEMLLNEVRDAAIGCGLINSSSNFSGPLALMLIQDMGKYIEQLEREKAAR